MSRTTQYADELATSVAERRHTEFAQRYPALDRTQFSSDNAYREALFRQYQEMRQIEYQQTCLHEGLKAYDVSISICERTNDNSAMNRATWNGCRDVLQNYPDMQTAISDSCYVRIPTHVTNSLSNGGSYNCCSVSSKALESKISAQMGFDGDQNFVKSYNQYGHWPDPSCHRAANGFVNDPACQGYVEHGNLWNMIEKGKVGPGATIAIQSSSTSSGYHAKTVIAVNYDENGKLKSYTLQGNNRNSLEVITQPQPAKYQNIYAGDMNRWMNEQLQRESENMRSMTTAQLETKVAQEKYKVNEQINQLMQTEQNLFTNHSSNQMVNDYADWYIKNANIPNATRYVMKTDRANADRQMENISQIHTQSRTRTNSQARTSPASRSISQTQATPMNQPTIPTAEQNQSAETKKMRTMLERMNKTNGANKQIDIDTVIDSFTQQFGVNASKVLIKTLMAPAQIAKSMNLKSEKGEYLRTSREVIQQLSKTENQSQNQQVLSLIIAQHRNTR